MLCAFQVISGLLNKLSRIYIIWMCCHIEPCELANKFRLIYTLCIRCHRQMCGCRGMWFNIIGMCCLHDMLSIFIKYLEICYHCVELIVCVVSIVHHVLIADFPGRERRHLTTSCESK